MKTRLSIIIFAVVTALSVLSGCAGNIFKFF